VPLCPAASAASVTGTACIVSLRDHGLEVLGRELLQYHWMHDFSLGPQTGGEAPGEALALCRGSAR
jgi:hypothetical protein